MIRPILTHHYQGSAAAIGTPGPGNEETLFLVTSGALRLVRITRFEWMSQATYDGLTDPSPTTLFLISNIARGTGSAHRWPFAADTMIAAYLGGAVVSDLLIGSDVVLGDLIALLTDLDDPLSTDTDDPLAYAEILYP